MSEAAAEIGKGAGPPAGPVKWTQIVGILLYTLLIVAIAHITLKSTIWRPINSTHGSWWMPNLIGDFMIASLGIGAGLFGFVYAYHRRRIFITLVPLGIVALLIGLAYFPLLVKTEEEVNFYPEIPGEEYLVGTWIVGSDRLTLFSNLTYQLSYPSRELVSSQQVQQTGTWRLERNLLYLDSLRTRWPIPWEVNRYKGYDFINYEIRASDLDSWSGGLGFMRERDWVATH